MSDCPQCGEPLALHTVPQNYVLLRIPFTNYTLELWDWGHKEMMCTWCPCHKHDRAFEQCFDAGVDKGYELAMRDNHDSRRH